MELPQRNRPSRGVLESQWVPTLVFLTVCTKNRRGWLNQPEIHEALVNLWQLHHDWFVGPYVLMPDHLHLFAWPSGEGLDFDRWVSKWKALLSRRYKHLGYRWQSGCFHHRLRGYESAESKWSYIQNNPVRAGLVSVAELWPYQGKIFRPGFWY